VQKSVLATRVLVALVLAVVVVLGLSRTHSAATALPDRVGPRDVPASVPRSPSPLAVC
jgi:APA family basic amino acid/polyamine antiporter